MEFNVRFQITLDKIPDNSQPTGVAILTLYLNVFDPWFGFSLKQQEPTDLQDVMEKVATLELYQTGFGKVDPLANPKITVPKAEAKAKTSNHVETPVDSMAQFAKMMMEMKQNQETIFQRLDSLEKFKSQSFQPRNNPEGKQFKRNPQWSGTKPNNDLGIPNPLAPAQMANQDPSDQCTLCQAPYAEEYCSYHDILNQEEQSPKDVNMMRDLDHFFSNAPRTFLITLEEMKATKEKSLDTRAIRLVSMQHLDEQAKEELRKKRYIQYQRRNKVPPNQPKTWTRTTLPLESNTPLPKKLG